MLAKKNYKGKYINEKPLAIFTPRVGVIPIIVGRMYNEYPRPCGIQSINSLINYLIVYVLSKLVDIRIELYHYQLQLIS